MKKLLIVILLVFLLCFTFSCQQGEEAAEEPAIDINADIAAIRNWVNLSYAAADSGDFEGYISFWAEGVIWMPPNAPIIQGISAATEMLQPYFEQVTIHHKISIKEIKVVDDFAFTRFNAEEKYTPKTGEGESVESNFKAIILLQRMADGTWLGTHLIWNSNDPLPASAENQ
jgi:ketosteroid isomerase-like protein